LKLQIIQHHAAEGPGNILQWAQARALDVEVFHSSQLPGADASPTILLGGPDSLTSAEGITQSLTHELAWLTQKHALGAPLLGICLGAQLLAKCLGAQVHPLAAPELGWCDVSFDDGQTRAVLQWHEDHFTLPPGAQLRASSAACPQQVFQMSEKLFGVQFHPEWNQASVAELNAFFGAQSPLLAVGKNDAARFQAVQTWFFALLDQWCSGWAQT
jgi:GMP synthase-like glutamine amidotransferase